MDRKFTKVGFSTLDGVLKLRFTTDVYREKVLERNGHEDVKLFDLPHEMSKIEAAAWLVGQRSVPASVKALLREMIAANDDAEAAVRAPRKRTARKQDRLAA